MQDAVTQTENETSPRRRGCFYRMFERRRYRWLIISMMVVFLTGLLYLAYFCAETVCASKSARFQQSPSSLSQFDAYLHGHTLWEPFKSDDLYRRYPFSTEGNDVLVFLHIQKTGGTTFGKHLVKNMNLSRPCVCTKGRKRCNCENSDSGIWLFSRYSTGWACGLHADWTELHACIDEKMDRREKKQRDRRYYRYLYITFLRDPLYRFISEWKHVQRGSTWKNAELKCNGRPATPEEIPLCFEGDDWVGVSLEEFMSCPYNLAINRQTRMLADLTLVGCYNKSAMSPHLRDDIVLQSAKRNLQSVAYFGLTEMQVDSQFLFECTFNLYFIKDFIQHNNSHATSTEITDTQQRRIAQLNKLDIELYQFAKQLFHQRVRYMKDYGCDMHHVYGTESHRRHVYDNFEEEDDYQDESRPSEHSQLRTGG